ncbi:hypothetical protein V6N00_08330 [Tersicoccus sp. MR15.9]|uniref:hypothetical protein n=1 Tax=Tersicoccus mangrovi TaxID=3121635 RepID=UPI002FE61FFC
MSIRGGPSRTVKREYDGPTFKRRLVAEGVAHAALVFDGDDAIAWCEYGSPAELPHIYRRKEYDAGETSPRRGASPASSSTATTGARASRGRRSTARWS